MRLTVFLNISLGFCGIGFLIYSAASKNLIYLLIPLAIFGVLILRDSFHALVYQAGEQKKETCSVFDKILSLPDKQREELDKEYRKYVQQAGIYLLSDDLKKRLLDVIEESRKQGFMNLLIGIAVVLSGVGVLMFSLIDYTSLNITEINTPKNPVQVNAVTNLVMRVTLSVFVQFVGLFFLSLYRNSISDIRFYHNEITNIELKTIAFFASGKESISDKRIVLSSLANTERNFVLKKGESTIGIELAKQSDFNGTIKQIIEAGIKGKTK